MCDSNTYYKYLGNFSTSIDDILEEYKFDPEKVRHPRLQTFTWDPVSYNEIHPKIKTLCETSCSCLGTQELLEQNPTIVVERHHNILTKKQPIPLQRQFGIHTDDDGPAGGPCQTILYYYHVDENLIDSHLDFYEAEQQKTPVCRFQPQSGDAVTFGNRIWHSPGNYRTESEQPALRGVLAIFICHEKKPPPKPMPMPRPKSCCPIFKFIFG